MKYRVELIDDSSVDVNAERYEVIDHYLNLHKGDDNVAIFAPGRWVGCYLLDRGRN